MHTNLERIINDIKTLATFNSTPGEGVTRSAYSKEDLQAKNYLKKEMGKIGLEIWEDGFSTLFGRREGNNPDLPAIMIGSHYDSVVNGGMFDGTSGVIAALETLRVLEENDISHEHPIEIIVMNAEEGETFGAGSGVSNSRAMLGTLTEKELDIKTNRFGNTKREAMKEYGLVPDLNRAKREPDTIKNFIELHIEQGPNLEKEQKDIGIVEFLPGIGRYIFRFYGIVEDSTSKMEGRKDALLAASMFNLTVHKIVNDAGKGVTGTVGEMNVFPNSHQFVADYVELTVEIRTMDKEFTKNINLKQEFLKEIEIIEKETGVLVKLEERSRIGYSNPTAPSIMDKGNVAVIQEICEKLNYNSMIINKGTGHDAMIIADFIPTNMIYVPSKGGITHDPNEWTDYKDLQKGIEVMFYLVQKLAL